MMYFKMAESRASHPKVTHFRLTGYDVDLINYFLTIKYQEGEEAGNIFVAQGAAALPIREKTIVREFIERGTRSTAEILLRNALEKGRVSESE